MDLWHLLGDLHPKLVHVPLILLLAGLLFDLIGVSARSERAHWAAKALTCVGTVGLLFAFICGIYAEVWAGRAGVPHHAIEFHEIAANVASWGFVVLAAWRLFLKPTNRGALALYVLIGLAWYALLILTAWLGGSLVYDYGAAVTGARANTALSLHDLNTLATRQTDENLKYSEWMHHIFGYMTLALSGSLFAHALFPKQAHKLRWVGPTLLLCGGVFLFFFADLDLYKLTDLRQLRDREVQLHKTIAIIMSVVGLLGLRRSLNTTAPGSRGPTDRASSLDDPAQPTGSITGLLVAVMALIGGGMLFTHVHTVAPYANVAAGVYVAHVVLGLVALAIGASRLLADAVPGWRRFFSVAFALFMCVESVLLITYNEGLPWYIGYGRYNRWGPHGGTVAPFGPIRAELTFDATKDRVEVQLLDRFKDEPTDVKVPPQHVLIARGYQEIAVPLRNIGWGRYTGDAPFLRDVPAFSARMAVGHYGMGYFDPWVTSAVVPVPPNEIARFVCPMHEGVRKTSAGECSLCGMPLVPIDTALRDTLHDVGYDMTLTAALDGPTTRLTLTPTKDGQVLRDLARVHEYLMHLIVVSPDLSFFDHVHPEPQPDGSFAIDYKFPGQGSYLLFADVTPKGARSQVFRVPVETRATSSSATSSNTTAQLVPSPALAKPLAADPTITAELYPSPRTPMAGMHSQLLFRLSKNGQPIIDLAPYIGAMGHCVILSEDTQTYLHSHPEQLFAPKPGARGGPEVAFHTRFPKPGRYKIWGQFKRGEQVLVADFVIDVKPSPLPQPVMNFVFGE